MDRVFNVLECEDQDKKRLAIFQLTYSTTEWWEAERAALGEEAIRRLSTGMCLRPSSWASIFLHLKGTRKNRNL